MRRLSLIGACLPLVALGLIAVQRPVRADEPDTRPIDDLVRQALKVWDVPGAAVVVVSGDRVIYLKGFGKRVLGEDKPVTPDTVFPMASCTKAFTTLALAMLVDEGKVSWDDPVRKHLPAFRLSDPLADENVVVRDLLCHRTGMAGNDFLWYHSPWSVEEQIRRIGLVKPSKSFRSGFQYQNIMFAAAGQVVATASGDSWDGFVRKRITDPLGMKGVSFSTPEALTGKDKDVAGPHRWTRAGKIENIPAWYAIEKPNAALSLNASARDLGPWLRFQLGDGVWGIDRLVSEKNLAETHMPQIAIRLEGIARKEQPCTTLMSYGLGWVIQDYRGHKLVSHGGNMDGMRAHISLAPDDQIGVAVLSNLENTRMNLALSNSIIDHLLGLEERDWSAHFQHCLQLQAKEAEAAQQKLLRKRHEGTKPTRELEAYAGNYEEPAYGSCRISVKDGKLTWHWNKFNVPLDHFHFDTFTAEDEVLRRPQVVFSLAADGDVASFRVFDVDFKKVKDK